MNAREPVTTFADLQTLVGDEMTEGYLDGFANERCGDNRSRSYWHGWRNGMVDGGHAEKDEAQAALAYDCLKHPGRWRPSRPHDHQRHAGEGL